MEVLSPKSANLPVKPREVMKKSSRDTKPKPSDKPVNPDKIDDKWRPPSTVTEPGGNPEAYLTGKKLGKGGFAVCFEGRTKSCGDLFALKVVKAEIQQKKMLEKFRTEMQIHAKMRHPNIVEFMRAFTVEHHTYVVLEICDNGSLADMVKARTCLSLPEVRRYMIQICGGVKYIHKRSVIHRDLKMGNVFIDAQMNLKIGDFGLAAVMADEQDRRTTLCGTPNYIAPEILSKSGARGHDCKVDTWAIGVICYAMLTGRPPFQSSTQQEIYNKLRTLEYEWKIDSINYIPQEAKDCVASCLTLAAAERPDMDELVAQDFFKMGAVADQLDVGCLNTKPTWLQSADPRGDRVVPGYGVSYDAICTECGVGKTVDGRTRPAVGDNAKISALVEIEVENRQGCAPVTPLPEGILYRQFQQAQAEWSMTQKHPLSVRPRSRKPLDDTSVASSLIAKVADDMRNDRPAPNKALPVPATISARPAQSFAAQQRQQAIPRSAMTRPTANPKEPSTGTREANQIEENAVGPQGLLKARPVRAASTRSVRTAESQVAALSTSSSGTGKIDELSERLLRETEDAESQSRPKTMSTLPTRSRSLRSRPATTTRATAPPAQSRRVASTLEEPLKPITGNARGTGTVSKKVVTSSEEVENHRPASSENLELLKHKAAFNPRLIDMSESYTLVPSSSYGKVMESLKDFHKALGQSALSSVGSARLRTTNFTPYPRVDKWVDYATKHGIAYILTDGSLGMILKSKEAESTASSCIVVRNARRHTVLRAKGIEHQFVPQGSNTADVEFYEQVDPTFAMKRLDVESSTFKLDLETHQTQTAAATTLLNAVRGSAAQHRVKEVGLLDKFGKYMNKQMGASDLGAETTSQSSSAGSASKKARSNFIHFFQRMGNVGVWRFAHGGLQFNFPDHTKLTIHNAEINTTVAAPHLSSDDEHSGTGAEVLVDVVYLHPPDATALLKHNVLTNEALERRGLRTFTLSSVLNATSTNSLSSSSPLRRSDVEILGTNQIREKLSWIRAIIGLWIKEGGLGWTGDEKLGWSGSSGGADAKKGNKLQWLTVGRPGGDAIAE